VTGQRFDTSQLDAAYWFDNLRQPVLFHQATRALLADGYRCFVETSPHPVLSVGMQETFDDAGQRAFALGSLRREDGGPERFLTSVAEGHTRGLPVDWTVVYAADAERVELPTYAFQRQRYWLADLTTASAVPATAPTAETDPPHDPPERLWAALSRKSPDEQRQELLELVCSYTSKVTASSKAGPDTGETIAPSTPFRELGFDSLMATELRNHLSTATGQHLPSTIIYEHPTPEDLAAHLTDQIRSGEPPGEPEVTTSAESLSALFLRACREGRDTELEELLVVLASLRPEFDTEGDLAGQPRTVWLCDGEEEPVVICFPSFVWQPTLYQYSRLASGLRGSRSAGMVSLPGFRTGEALPADVTALAQVLGDAAVRAAGGRRFALLGHSGGGSIASVVTEHLERRGAHPGALVLLNTPTWGGEHGLNWAEWGPAVQSALLDRQDLFDQASDNMGEAWITARARYATLDYSVAAIAAPTLLVRASERLGQSTTGDGWRVSWRLEHTAVDAPGDHFSMLEADNALTVAQTIDTWLGEVVSRCR
jgi:surfactin synthase thioesterase subunit/acyl carrier protein